jgi:ABC-type lipoprotein export system ATPase subunit
MAINFTVAELGPNGAGKTTSIRLLLGLNRPTAGGGTIFGHDIVEDSLEIRKRVGYLAQHPHFYDEMTAREILRFTANLFYNGPASKIEARIDEMLELVDLEDKADRRIKGYSGGERQRLGIAQAQINDPDLLILDEPAAAPDPMGRLAMVLLVLPNIVTSEGDVPIENPVVEGLVGFFGLGGLALSIGSIILTQKRNHRGEAVRHGGVGAFKAGGAQFRRATGLANPLAVVRSRWSGSYGRTTDSGDVAANYLNRAVVAGLYRRGFVEI